MKSVKSGLKPSVFGKNQTSSPALRTQACQECGFPMGDMPGSRDAICGNCGYKDPCCE